jgi:hypothetical protein
MMVPIDTATGLQAGSPVPHTSTVEVLVGYLVTHPDGYEARVGPDRTRADLYAARNHATVEPMYVKRPSSRQAGAGGAIGAAAMPR